MRLIRSAISIILTIFIYIIAVIIQLIASLLKQVIKLINHKPKNNEKAKFKSKST
jgi:predicted PurR-regulated permease PerM